MYARAVEDATSVNSGARSGLCIFGSLTSYQIFKGMKARVFGFQRLRSTCVGFVLKHFQMVVVHWSQLRHLQVDGLVGMCRLGASEMICRLSVSSLLQIDALVYDQRAIQIVTCIL